MKHLLLAIILLVFCNRIFPQSEENNAPSLNLSGFMDVFYTYDFSQPEGTFRQPFFFNHNRHNEFNLNLGLIKFNIDHEKYRGNLALHTGTYANDNYAAEPGLLKNIFEANVGISLNQGNSVWLDAGILPSHIGFESAISTDNPTLTRSLPAENSPYFLTGAKLTFYPNDDVEIAALVVNGWQRIQRLEGNTMPSFGTQVYYSPSENLTLNWSTFIGTDDPDSTRRMRYFNNFYGIFSLGKKGKIITGFDLGAQQILKNNSEYVFWLTPIIIGQIALNEKWKTAIRAEYYRDPKGLIVPFGGPNGFQTTGISWNWDFLPIDHIVWRIEGRWFASRDNSFNTPYAPTNRNFFIATSLALSFEEGLRQ